MSEGRKRVLRYGLLRFDERLLHVTLWEQAIPGMPRQYGCRTRADLERPLKGEFGAGPVVINQPADHSHESVGIAQRIVELQRFDYQFSRVAWNIGRSIHAELTNVKEIFCEVRIRPGESLIELDGCREILVG